MSRRTYGALPDGVRSSCDTTSTSTGVPTTPAARSAPATAACTAWGEFPAARPARRTRSRAGSWTTCHPPAAAWSSTWWNTMGCTLTGPAEPCMSRTSSIRPSMSSSKVKERPHGQPRPPSLTVSDISYRMSGSVRENRTVTRSLAPVVPRGTGFPSWSTGSTISRSS